MVKSEKIGRNFLKQYDEFIKNELRSIECLDIDKIYWDFSKGLKEYKGNSQGFYGLSEYLIFRFVYNLLGRRFRSKNLTKEIIIFQSGNLELGQNIPVELSNGKKYRPDIVIKRDNKVIAIIQIKIYPTNGVKEIEKEMSTLIDIRNEYIKMRALLLIFHVSKKGKVKEKINYYTNKNKWFEYLELKENKKLLSNELKNKLLLPANVRSYG